MRTLLVHPPLNPQSEIMPPLGLCNIAAWLIHHGHTVSVLDFDLELKNCNEAERFENISVILQKRITLFAPDLLCVTSMYSNSLYAEYIIREAKRMKPTVVTVAGGSHFGAQGKHSLQRIAELDYVIEGEGETALLELLDFLQTNIPVTAVHNLVYRNERGIQHTEKAELIPLDALPNTWELVSDIIDIRNYFNTIPAGAERKIMYVEAGRGCPYHCSFCATAPYWNRKYRVKPPELIAAEIKLLHNRYGYNSFILIHDLLPVNKKFINALCDEITALQLPVAWMMNSRTDIDLDGYLPKLKAAGCWKMFYGVESSSPRIQELISKHLDRSETLHTLTTNLEHGIASTCSFVFGFPDETPAEISGTIKLAALCKMNGAETVQLHRLRLFPPSRLAAAGLATSFDLESLRIEYPFVSITDDEINEIENDSLFFMGYHSLLSLGGTKEQLAQVEMFFHHAIALAPLTVSLCCTFYGDALVDAFYRTIEKDGYLRREDIEWQTADVHSNWMAVKQLLHALTISDPALPGWQQTLLQSVFEYEDIRLHFCAGKAMPAGREYIIDAGEGWMAICSAADISATADILKSEGAVTANLLAQGITVFSSKNGKNLAYSLEAELQQQLLERDEEVMGVIEG